MSKRKTISFDSINPEGTYTVIPKKDIAEVNNRIRESLKDKYVTTPTGLIPRKKCNVNSLKPFKGRKIDYNQTVDVYRNLNRKGKIYSIRQNGLVVAHGTDITLWYAEFIVNESGKNRAILSGQRNVHAFIRGKILEINSNIEEQLYLKIVYLPFQENGFHFIKKYENKALNIPIVEAHMVRIYGEGVWAGGVVTTAKQK